MFRYNKISREESDKSREYPVLENGVYRFQVHKATFQTSKTSGNPQLKLELTVWDKNDDQQVVVFDYLIATEKMDWKTRHFADSVGLSEAYEREEFSERLCPGREGLVSLGIQDAQDKPGGGMYPRKNVVIDYVMTFGGATKSDLEKMGQKNTFGKKSSEPAPFLDDDIKF